MSDHTGSSARGAAPLDEGSIIFLVGAVQFVNILDFMMVMPLGPDFASALGISTSHLGWIGGAYTASAAIAGLIGSLFLDRFDRRKALAVALGGLVLGTFAGGFAQGLPSLLAARVLAGAFGGPATSLSLSIIADVIPPERRGKAMGQVMGAFAVASVLGVPAGLELARLGGWQLPFFGVGALGLVVAVLALARLPPLTLHLQARHAHPRPTLRELLRPTIALSYAMTAVVMMSGFLIIPNVSAYAQGNLGYPRSQLGLLYLAGGSVSFFSMRLVGRLVDRLGSFPISLAAAAGLLVVLLAGFVANDPRVPVLAIFVAFMFFLSSRNVAYNTLTSKVPAAHERAGFLSVQSAVQHLASAAGAFLSAQLLRERPGGGLDGMPSVAAIAMALTVLVPLLVRLVERRVLAATTPEALPLHGEGLS